MVEKHQYFVDVVVRGEVVKEGIRLSGVSPVLIPPADGMIDAGRPEGVIRGLHYRVMEYCQKDRRGDLAILGHNWAEQALRACW